MTVATSLPRSLVAAPRREVRAGLKKRSLVFYLAIAVAYGLVIYPVMNIVYEAELFIAGVRTEFNPLVIVLDAIPVHWPSMLFAMGLLAIPAVIAGHVRRKRDEAVSKIEEMNHKQREFMSVISHEFRTPLTAIQGFSELIRDDSLPLEQIREFADDINTDARRLSRMIGEMLDLDRLEAGRTRMHLVPTNAGETAAGVVSEMLKMAPHHVLMNQVGPVMVMADPDQLLQVFTNLLANAVKYTPAGSAVTLSSSVEGGLAHFVVADDGPGIPVELLEKIWERYYRIESTDTAHTIGTGLGLPIVRRIVEALGGRAWADSGPRRGAEFHFTVPLVMADAAAVT